jgi:small multidrug resistance family-3 protein
VQILRSVALFVLAGCLEIGGGWLVWQALRASRPLAWGVAGALALALYGVVAALQPASFGRVYAAYGGVFIAMSVAWGWAIHGARPDRMDVLGALIALAGAAVIMYGPRQ